MPKVAPDTIPRAKQRTRRSHKNSKDGCPNCRAKRVKCGEELPSCLQCIRKKCRCGYLDFPPERLEHLARKNESKREAALEIKGASTDNSLQTNILSASASSSTPLSQSVSHPLNPQNALLIQLLQMCGHNTLHYEQDKLSHRSKTPENLQLRDSPSPLENSSNLSQDQSRFSSDTSPSVQFDNMALSGQVRDRTSGNMLNLRSTLQSNISLKEEEYTTTLNQNHYQLSGLQNYLNVPQPQPSLFLLSPRASQSFLTEKSLSNKQNRYPAYINGIFRLTQVTQQPTPPHLFPPQKIAPQSVIESLPLKSHLSQASHFLSQSSSKPLKPHHELQNHNNYNNITTSYQDLDTLGFSGDGSRPIPIITSDKLAGSMHLSNLMPHTLSLSVQIRSMTNPVAGDQNFSVPYSVSPKSTPIYPLKFGVAGAINNTPPGTGEPVQYSDHVLGQVFHPSTFQELQIFHPFNLNYLHDSGALESVTHSMQAQSTLDTLDPTQRDYQTSPIQIPSKFDRNLGLTRMSTNRQSLVKVRDREHTEEERDALLRPLFKVRNLVNSNVFNAVYQDLGQVQKPAPEDFKLWGDDKLFNSGGSLGMESSEQFLFNHGISLAVNSTHISSGKDTHDFLTDTLGATSLIDERTRQKGTPLPNAIVQQTRFPRLKVPAYLNNPIIEQLVLQSNKAGRDPLELDVFDLGVEYRPVWTEHDSYRFWLVLFQQAAVLDLYFQFFIDRSVNILLRASDTIVNGAIISFNQELNSANSLDHQNDFFQFFYNKKDLMALTKKSYVAYGNLIRKLRDSIALVGNQYAARMSLFSSLSSYTHPSPDISSFFLMFTGTLMILLKVLEESNLLKIHSSLKQQVMQINLFCIASRYPEYSSNVVKELNHTFQTYKSYVQEQISLYEAGHYLNPDYKKALNDPIFHHGLQELDKFLQKLQNQYYPEISKCNNYYKALHNYEANLDIQFVSPLLIYDLAFEWFRYYPGDKMSMGLNTNPLKKVLYLFYHALAKCLSHVITPIKSLSIVDACNISMTKVGMEFSKLGESTQEDSILSSLAKTLFRTIRFFENRLRLFGYYMEHSTVLNDIFVAAASSEPPSAWRYRDIVHLLPKKLTSGELQVQLFSKNTLTIDHYAFMNEFSRDSNYAPIIQAEIDRQNYALQNEPVEFLYDQGLTNHEFNPQAIIHCLSSLQLEASRRNGPLSNEAMKKRIDNLLETRQVISEVRKTIMLKHENSETDDSTEMGKKN